MKTLTLEQLLELHVLAISQGGGSDGVRDMGRLESALAAQKQEVFGQEIYPSLFDKAAAMARGIIGDHPFIDGNKRTAMLTALTFLELNNHIFKAKLGELEDFVVKIAVDKLDIAQIATWFKKHAQKS